MSAPLPSLFFQDCNMNKKVASKVASRVGLIFLLFYFFIIPGLIGAKPEYDPGLRDLNQQVVLKNENGVRINVQNILLSTLLQYIHDRSGIEFKLGYDVVDEVITTSISASTWTEAVRILLKEFNKVEVWANDKDLSRVVVLDGEVDKILDSEVDKNGQTESPQLIAETQNIKTDFSSQKDFIKTQNQQTYTQATQSEVPLNWFQLRRLVRTRPGKLLSNSLFQEPRSREFLHLRGIDSPEDWKQVDKAKSIQNEAHDYLQILKKQRDAKRKELQSN